MRASAAARRYARALFALAREDGRIEPVRGELAALAELLDRSDDLRHALLRPLFPAAERRAVVRAVLSRTGASATVVRFCSFLVDQRRIVAFDAIRDEYERLADAAAGRTQARVVSAVPLSDAQRERLRGALAGRLGRDVELDVQVDATLLGGAVASVGTTVYDGSLRTQLAQLRASLTKGH